MTSAPQARSLSISSGFEVRLLDAGAVRVRGRLAIPAVPLDERGSLGPLWPEAGCRPVRPEPRSYPAPAAAEAS